MCCPLFTLVWGQDMQPSRSEGLLGVSGGAKGCIAHGMHVARCMVCNWTPAAQS